MLTNILAGIMLLTPIFQVNDTTFVVDPDARLELTNRDGSIVIQTWDRDEVSVRTDRWSRSGIEVRHRAGAVLIGVSRRYWDDDDDKVNYRLRVPATMPLDLRGSDTDIRVEGSRGEVNIDVHDGDVILSGGHGRVTIRTDDGTIDVENSEGRILLSSMDGDVTVHGAEGDVEVDATDGEIILLDIHANSVDASTVDGDIWFDGVLAPRGSYSLTTHDGDITVEIPEATGARVRMARHDGEFASDFPLTMQRWPMGRRIEFNLGNGSADLQIEAFDGDIELRHRGGRFRRF